jgi:hypothetical protein
MNKVELNLNSMPDSGITPAMFHPDAVGTVVHGLIVEKAASALPQTDVKALFTIAGGYVAIKALFGIVTVLVGAVANNTKLKLVPTSVGATTDLCAVLTLNAAAAYSILSITGVFAGAMIKSVDIPVAGASWMMASPILAPPGTIQVDCAGSDGGTGRVKWVCIYTPLTVGATLVAA